MKVKLAIDFGSANIKMLGMVEGFEKRCISKSLATTKGIDENNCVELFDRKIYFGSGYSLVKKDKTERDYVIESVFFATDKIYGELDNEFEVDLAIGLPLSQYKIAGRIEYENKLKDLYLNKQLNGKVNGKHISIKINFLKIYAEGYSGFIALYDEVKKDMPFLIVDVGYKTTDVLGIGKEIASDNLVIQDYTSINEGMSEVFEDIKDKFFNDNKIEYDAETIEYAILTNQLLKVNNEEVDPKQWLKYGSEVVTDVFNTIETKLFPDMKTRNIYLIGGGVDLIYKILQQMDKHNKYKDLDVEILINKEQSMFANVVGYYMQLEKDLNKMKYIISEDRLNNLNKKKKSIAITEE